MHTCNVEDLYAKDKNLKREDVQIIQEWLKKQPHLPKVEEYQILAFLCRTDYRIEPAKTLIDLYFTFITHQSKLFRILKDDIFKQILSYTFTGIMPKKTPEGDGVLVVKFPDTNSEVNENFLHFISAGYMVSSLNFHQNGFLKNSYIIFDAEFFRLSHLSKFDLGLLKPVFNYMQHSSPTKLKGIHLVNVFSGLEKIKLLMKPLVSNEIYNMLWFHSSTDSLYKHIPQECLPEDYGGFLPSLQVLKKEIVENVLENYDFYHWLDSQKVDETKRMGKLPESVFGPVGTFKKLELD